MKRFKKEMFVTIHTYTQVKVTVNCLLLNKLQSTNIVIVKKNRRADSKPCDTIIGGVTEILFFLKNKMLQVMHRIQNEYENTFTFKCYAL